VSRHYRHQVDPCQAQVVKALRAAGASVVALTSPAGIPDLLVGWKSRTLLVECKSPPGPNGGDSRPGQHLSPAQERFAASWRGVIHVVHSPEEALQAVFG
jgi:hypothetical protein